MFSEAASPLVLVDFSFRTRARCTLSELTIKLAQVYVRSAELILALALEELLKREFDALYCPLIGALL